MGTLRFAVLHRNKDLCTLGATQSRPRGPRGTSSRLVTTFGALAVLSLLVTTSRNAAALEPTGDMGDKGQLVIDQISGFRVSTTGGLTYYGPLGFSTYSLTERQYRTDVTEDVTTHYTTFFLAPSADIFVIDHLSVGGLIEFASTSVSVDDVVNGVVTSYSAPGTTDLTFLPRVGWMFPLGDKFGIWPRAGIGYVSRQTDVPQRGFSYVRDTFNGLILDFDVGFLFRFTNSFFIKAAPELAWVPGGSHSQSVNGVTTSANANAFQFALVSGIGGILQL